MSSNLVPDPENRHPCAFDLKQPCAWLDDKQSCATDINRGHYRWGNR